MPDQQPEHIKTLNIAHGGKGSQIRAVLDTKTNRVEITNLDEPFISVPLTVWQVKEIAKFLLLHGY